MILVENEAISTVARGQDNPCGTLDRDFGIEPGHASAFIPGLGRTTIAVTGLLQASAVLVPSIAGSKKPSYTR